MLNYAGATTCPNAHAMYKYSSFHICMYYGSRSTSQAITNKPIVITNLIAEPERFLERLVDEDERYEAGEALLGEPRDVAHEGGQVKRHDQQDEERCPQADPAPERQEVETHVTKKWEIEDITWVLIF